MTKVISKAAKRNAEVLESLGLHPNLDYGHGSLHRKILLRKSFDNSRSQAQGQHSVIAELEDNCHQFRVRLFHNTKKVCAVNGDVLRYPNNTCPGSLDLLNRLIDIELGQGPSAFAKNTNPREFCTHLFDLASLAYTHATRDDVKRLYHAVVYDEDDDGVTHARVNINDNSVLDWHLKQQIIQNDGIAKGVSVHSGFTRWATSHLQGDELEAAIVLAKANFVATSRRVDTEQVAGTQLVNGIMPKDTCYTYRSPIMEQAYHMHGSTIDYSDRPEQMLKFIEIF